MAYAVVRQNLEKFRGGDPSPSLENSLTVVVTDRCIIISLSISQWQCRIGCIQSIRLDGDVWLIWLTWSWYTYPIAAWWWAINENVNVIYNMKVYYILYVYCYVHQVIKYIFSPPQVFQCIRSCYFDELLCFWPFWKKLKLAQCFAE